MSEPFVAEIRMFGGNFAPRGNAFCNGQLLPIAQNTALFSLIGTTYGGDGRTTTALPNLQDRIPMHPGRGPGLTPRRLGERGGVTEVTLTEAQLASHGGAFNATPMMSRAKATETQPDDKRLGRRTDTPNAYKDAQSEPAPALTDLPVNATIGNAGGGQAHNNMQPFLAINFIIALVGTYPSRS